MPSIFPGGVSRASAARDQFRRGDLPSSKRSSPMTWGQLEAFLSGEVGRYSGLISNARAYAESPWVAPSVHVFAATCAARIFRMFRDTGGDKERILDHPLIDLMARPNTYANLSEYLLKYWTFALYDYDGEVLWHLGRAGGAAEKAKARPKKKPTSPDFITVFRKSEAQPFRDRDGEFTGWTLSIDGTQYFADRDDVIHFPRFDPVNATASFNPFTMQVREPTRGRSSLDSKRRALSADAAMQNFNTEFFSRGISPNFAFIGPPELTEPQKDQFRDRLMARLAGRQEPVIMGGAWTIENLGVTQKDAQFSQGRHDARDEILAGRIPPIYVGDRDATYANAQQQVLTFLESIIIPALTHFCATLDVNLLGDEPDVWTDLATDDIYALQIAKKDLVSSALDLVARGKAPMDVAARTVGLEMETFEGSDVGFGTAMDIPVADLLSVPDADTTDTGVAVVPDASTGVPADDTKVGVGTNILATIAAVVAGKIPRDSGIKILMKLGNMTEAEAEEMMASAGKADVPTTPNPNPAADAAAQAAQQQAPADQVARFIRIPAPPRIRIVDEARMAGPFEWASSQVNLAGDAAAALLALGSSIPDEALAEKGRETDAHITVKFGIAPDVSIDQVIEALANSAAVVQMVERGGGVMTFGKSDTFTAEVTGKDYDVVYVAIEAADLIILNSVLAMGVETTATQSTYKPHATLAYVTAGRGAEFVGLDALDGVEVKFDEIQFSDVDGNLTPISLAEAVKARAVRPQLRGVDGAASATRAAGDAGLQALIEIIREDDKDLQKLARRFHVRMLSEGARQALKLIKPSAALTSIVPIDNPHVVEFLKTRANLITSVNRTTGDQILATAKERIKAGDTPENIANGIRDVYNARGAQAKLIARNENGTALSGGRFIQMQEEGVDAGEWLSSRDGDRVRESHAMNTGVDGEIVALGEKFSNGCRYPQDPEGEPGETIGCRCVILPASLSKGRGSLLPNEKQRETYWRASVVVSTRSTEKQFKGALQKYFNDQRGRVLAELAKLLAA